MKLLLVEDDDRVALALVGALGKRGMDVHRVSSAGDALDAFGSHFDVVILDLTLPDLDGFHLCARLRRISSVPIVMATARSGLSSRIQGLELGADDYLVKPYDLRELIARIHAVTRRYRAGVEEPVPPRPDRVAAGALDIDFKARAVHVAAKEVSLTRKEFDLLGVLCEDPDRVWPRHELIKRVWQHRGGDGHTLEVHVASLRAKLGGSHAIRTVRGIGYQLGRL